MSAPGAPPETSDRGYGGLETPDEEPRQVYRGTPNLFDSNAAPLAQTNDERFAPGTPPNMTGQLTVPDQPIVPKDAPTPGRFPDVAPSTSKGFGGLETPSTPEEIRTGVLRPMQQWQQQRHSLLDPRSVAEQQYPIRRRDEKIYKQQLSPTPEAEKPSYNKLTGGIPTRQETLGRNAQSWMEFAMAPREQGGLGLSPAGAAGLIGNLRHESGRNIDPNAVGDSGASVGAAQWQGSRRTQLERMPNARSTNTQQRHMHQELNGPYRQVYERLLQAKTPEEAALVFGKGYEGYGDKSSTPKRVATARAIFDAITRGGSSVTQPTKVAISDVTQQVAGPDLSVGAPPPEYVVPARISPSEAAIRGGQVAMPAPVAAPAPVVAPVVTAPTLAAPVTTGGASPSILTTNDGDGPYFNIPMTGLSGRQVSPERARQLWKEGKIKPFSGPHNSLEEAYAAKGIKPGAIMPPAAAAPVVNPSVATPITAPPAMVAPPATIAPVVAPVTKAPVQQRTIPAKASDDSYYNIPTIVNGKQVSDADADTLWRTGRSQAVSGPFDTVGEAVKAAADRVATINQRVTRNTGPIKTTAPTDPASEAAFQKGIRRSKWFKEYVEKFGEEPDLNDPTYDYRAAWLGGARVKRDPNDGLLHWPSQYKSDDHPNLIVDNVNTKTGKYVGPTYDTKPFTTMGDDGQYYNIPTVVNGKPITNKGAVALWKQGTNPPASGPFKTLNEAIAALGQTAGAPAAPPTTVQQITQPTLAQPAPASTAPVTVAPPIAAQPALVPQPLPWKPRLSQTTQNLAEISLERMQNEQAATDAMFSQVGEQPLYQTKPGMFDRIEKGPISVAPEAKIGTAALFRPDIKYQTNPMSPENQGEVRGQPDPDDPRSMLDRLTEAPRWAAQGVVSATGKLPFQIGAGLSAPLAIIDRAIGVPDKHNLGLMAYDWQMNKATKNIDEVTKQLFGFSKDEKPAGALYYDQAFGETFSPMPGIKYALMGWTEKGKAIFQAIGSAFGAKETITMSAVNLGARWMIDPNMGGLITPSEAATSKKLEVKERPPETPGQVARGNVMITTLPAPVQAITKQLDDGTFALIPRTSIYGMTIKSRQNLSDIETLKQFARTGMNLGVYKTEKDALDYLEMMNTKVAKNALIAGGAGTGQIKESELKAMGILGALNVGILVAPGAVRYLRTYALPGLGPGKAVKSAVPGTRSYTNLWDYTRSMVDDANAPLMNLARRMGLSNDEIKAQETRFYGMTRASASTTAVSATTTGKALANDFSFELRPGTKSLAELERVDAPDVRRMLFLLDALDQVQLQKKPNVSAQGVPAPGQPPVNPGQITGPGGLTETDMQNELIKLQSHPTRGPELVEIADHFALNNKELYRSLSTGPDAILTQTEAHELATTRPFRNSWGRENPEDVSPFSRATIQFTELIRQRLENAAHNGFVSMAQRVRPGMFMETTFAQKEKHPWWEPNTITLKDAGVTRYYTTDPTLASIMKADPLSTSSPGFNALMWGMELPKRAFETGTTRWGNPFFALTQAPRNVYQAYTSAATNGMTLPGPIRLATSFPKQAGPIMAKVIAQSLDYNSGGWLGRAINATTGGKYQGWVNSLEQRLATMWKDSDYAAAQYYGSHYGSVPDRAAVAEGAWADAIRNSSGGLRQMLATYKDIFGAFMSIGPFAVNRANVWRTKLSPTDPRYMSGTELAAKTRGLTGDPAISGQTISPSGWARYNSQGMLDELGAKGARIFGGAAGTARTFGPWFNSSLTGFKRVVRAWEDHPAKFLASAWGLGMSLEGAAFLWNQHLGRDSQGQSYSEYALNGRGPSPTMLNFYFGIPGRPVAEGLEAPLKIHEMTFLTRAFQLALHHAFQDPSYTTSEDFKHALSAWTGLVFDVPLPPPVNMLLATEGVVGRQGVGEGESYFRRRFPFDQNVGLPVNVELMMRAIWGALGQSVAQGMSVAMQEKNPWKAPATGVKEFAKEQVMRAPFLRNVFDMTPPMSGNTRASREFFETRKLMQKFDEFFRNYGEEGGGRRLKNKGASGYGEAVTESQAGPPTPEIAPGMPQPETTNPIYRMHIGVLHKLLTKDDYDKGGMGFKTATKMYYKTNKELQTLQGVHTASYSGWQQWIYHPDNKPLVEFLEKNNVDHANPTAVKNFYQARRQVYMKVLNNMFKIAQHEIQVLTGKPFTWDMLEPYKMQGLPGLMPAQEVGELIGGAYYGGTADVPKGPSAPGSMNP